MIYPILVVGTLNYSDRDPSLDNMDIYFRKKDAIANSLGNEPRLFVIGGSSAFYGIDALLMEKNLGIPVINYGMHAGLGLEYPLKRLLRLLKANDSVLLAFESSHYATATDQFTNLLHYYVFTNDYSYIFDNDFQRALQKFYGIPLGDFLSSWKLWKQTVKRKNPFYGVLKEKELAIFMDQRGDRHAADTWRRPLLQMVPPPELSPYAEKIIKKFIYESNKRNVKVYFTWPTAGRRVNLLTADAKRKGQQLQYFLQTQGIVVIDDYADHLYPLPFYTDTPYHLSRAGTHIRTEKLIKSLRPYFTPNRTPPITNSLFLLDERHHTIEYFPYDGSTQYDFKVYMKKADSDYMLDDSGIQRALMHGGRIYFSDESLKSIASKKIRIETVRCSQRSLETDIAQYNNHIFFMILNHVDKITPLNKNVLPPHFYDALAGRGYRAMALGTGRYSSVNIVQRDGQLSEMTLKKMDRIGNLTLPFTVHMVSTKKPSSQLQLDQFSFFEKAMYKPGIWILVYDPDISIIVDNFIYPDMVSYQSACLYKMSN